MAEKKEEKVTMYHYTSPENAKKIADTGVIKPSSSGHYGGDKVYLTSKSPTAGRKAIAQNNYDGMTNWQNREKQGNVDAVVSVEVDKSKVTREADPDGRDIYTHKGPLKLGGGQ